MNNLTLQQIEKLGISKWMSDKEVQRAIEKALQEQLACLESKEIEAEQSKQHTSASLTLEEVLVSGGLFTYNLNGKKYKLNVLTKDDMQLLDNIENLIEEGVEYDIVKPYKFHCLTAHDTYLTVKAKDYTEAQILIDNILGKGLYKASASKL